MADIHQRCENCGNQYDKPMFITHNGNQHIFDSFECAINRLAPKCEHCATRIIGHGVENNGAIFCCVHCAKASGVINLRDRADELL